MQVAGMFEDRRSLASLMEAKDRWSLGYQELHEMEGENLGNEVGQKNERQDICLSCSARICKLKEGLGTPLGAKGDQSELNLY